MTGKSQSRKITRSLHSTAHSILPTYLHLSLVAYLTTIERSVMHFIRAIVEGVETIGERTSQCSERARHFLFWFG